MICAEKLAPPAAPGSLSAIPLATPDGMANAFVEHQTKTDLGTLEFDERFSLLVDAEWMRRHNKRLQRRSRSRVGLSGRLSRPSRPHEQLHLQECAPAT